MIPMTVELIMTKKVFKVRMDDTIGTIREILDNANFHHLLVVEGNKLVGVISDRDVLKAVSPFIGTLSEHNHDLVTLNKKAHQIMNHKPITVFKDVSLHVAATIMLDNNISCLPVVSLEGEVEGIVTWKDILRYYMKDNEE
jgi:acetoin utilization protein AcuB